MSRPGYPSAPGQPANPGIVSPHFNPPNGLWDNGEGFPSGGFAPDHGAYHDADHANIVLSAVGPSDVHSYVFANGTQGWQPYDPDNPGSGLAVVRRFVGYLRPASLGPIPQGQQVTDAAFEIFAPLQRDPSKHLIVYIGAWATSGTPQRASQPAQSVPFQYDYPGHRLPEGLVVNLDAQNTITSIRRPGDGAWHVLNPPSDFQVIYAYIVPRVFPRCLTFVMQRDIQLAKAIDLMLAEPVGSPFLPPTFAPLQTSDLPTPKMVLGGSFGGLTAQLAVLAHPDVFHGACSASFSASLRRAAGEQAAYNFIGRSLGMYGPESSKGPWDVLWWASYLRQIGWDYFNSSTTMRLRKGDAVRPMLFLVADEDTVTTGVDNIPPISNSRGYVERGIRPGSPLVAWTIVDKRCHAEPGYYQTPIGNVTEVNPNRWVNELAPHVFESWIANPVAPPLPLRTDDGSEDPYAEFFDRGVLTPVTSSQHLTLDAGFRSPARQRPALGHGTAFGWDESLRVKAVNGEQVPSIFVVSADGVATRFAVENVPAAGGYPAYQTVTAQVSSPALGAGAYALAVGEVDAAQAGDEVVVGTQRWIHLLHASDLTVIRSRALDFEHEQPRRIQIARVQPQTTNPQIVFTTFYGHLMVLDEQLQTLTDFGEPGIQDFAVHEGQSYAAASTSSKVPITILSFRGHLANVTLNVPGGPVPCPAELHCWTEAQYGGPADLEVAQTAGGPVVVASFGCSGSVENAVRVFDALTLQPGTPSGFGAPAVSPGTNAVNDLSVVHDTSGNVAAYVLCVGQDLFLLGITGQVTWTRLFQFGPFTNVCAVATADLVPSSNYAEEIVVSTLPGHVVFFTVDELLYAVAHSIQIVFDRPGENGLPYTAKPPRTNHTLAGTWGLISRWYTPDGEVLLPQLVAANQAGGLFEVEPSDGRSTAVLDLRLPQEVALPTPRPPPPQVPSYFDFPSFTLPAFPIRDLGVIAENAIDVPPFYLPLVVTPDRCRLPVQVAPPRTRQHWWYRSLPNQNRSPFAFEPEFYKDYGDQADAQPPHLPVCTGIAAFICSGAVQAFPPGPPSDLVREFHWWGGERGSDQNLIQGACATDAAITNSWYSTKEVTGSLQSPPPYGAGSSEGKDLRNHCRDATTFNLQSLRLGRDDVGTVIVAGTPGGGVTLLRPGDFQFGTTPNSDFGTVLWPPPGTGGLDDDGHGCMALAVRKAPEVTPAAVDIFYGACLSYPDPQAVAPSQPGFDVAGSVRWLRWQSGAMQEKGIVHLDRGGSPSIPAGFGVCGIAVGNIVDSNPGDELVVATLAGDVYVLDLSTGTIDPTPLDRLRVPGSVGAFNGIVIDDIDFDLRKELYVAGTQGIWKWRQP